MERHLVLRNEKVGKLAHGGHAGELDIVAYSPQTHTILHLEPSLDAESWPKREARYTKKFAAGREHIHAFVDWIEPKPTIRQIAIFGNAATNRTHVAGGEIVTVDEVAYEIREAVCEQGKASRGAIPEQFLLLRTIQLIECGYLQRKSSTRLRITAASQQ